MLPESIDVLFLSVGSDGHIASLYPQSNALNEKTKSVVPVVGPKPPPERLTITTSVIQPAKATFLFAQGKEKVQILEKALESPNNISSFPVRLVLGAHGYLTLMLQSNSAKIDYNESNINCQRF